MPPAAPSDTPTEPTTRFWPIALVVGVVASALRWLPLANGGGLLGIGTATDGTAYAAALGIWHEPLAQGFGGYRDVVTTTPPGLLAALGPFALLGSVGDERVAFAMARVAWMLMGTTTAVLIARLLRRHGAVAMLVGGLVYAVHAAAVAAELTVSAIAPANLATVVALLLLEAHLRASQSSRRRRVVVGVLVGLLLGFALTSSCWTAPTALVVLVVVAVRRGRQTLTAVLGGLAVAVAAFAGPFLAAAPGPTWRLLVVSWWGGVRDAAGTDRMVELLGLAPYAGTASVAAVLVVTVAVVASVVGAALDPFGRVVGWLLLADGAALVARPGWDQGDAGLVAPALALLIGIGVGVGSSRAAHAVWRPAGVAGLVLLGLGVVAVTAPQTQVAVGRPFPGSALAEDVYLRPGCVVSDDAVALVELDVLGRNLERGCEPVVDLDAAYTLRHAGEAHPPARVADAEWQALLRTHFRSGDTMVLVRYRRGEQLSTRTADEVAAWWAVTEVGDFKLRQPTRR